MAMSAYTSEVADAPNEGDIEVGEGALLYEDDHDQGGDASQPERHSRLELCVIRD